MAGARAAHAASQEAQQLRTIVDAPTLLASRQRSRRWWSMTTSAGIALILWCTDRLFARCRSGPRPRGALALLLCARASCRDFRPDYVDSRGCEGRGTILLLIGSRSRARVVAHGRLPAQRSPTRSCLGPDADAGRDHFVVKPEDGWQPTTAHARALLGGLLLGSLPCWLAVRLLVLSDAVVGCRSVGSRAAATVFAGGEPLDRPRVVREGEATTWHIEVRDPEGGSTTWRPCSRRRCGSIGNRSMDRSSSAS